MASSAPPSDPVMRRNFYHLYADIAGFGVLSGSTLAFIAIYMARLGASSWQIGLLTAGPALVNLVFALPAGQWLAERPLTTTVFWTSIGQRLLYPLLVPLCLWLPATWQNPLILALVVLTSIPGTALAIGFNALFAEAVPEAWRGEVVGRRNALLALTVLVSTLGCGQLLRVLPFTTGYAVVFAIGAAGALYSSYHLARVRLQQPLPRRQWRGAPLGVGGRSGRPLTPDAPLNRGLALRVLISNRLARGRAMLAPLHTAFGPFFWALFSFHTAQYVPIPLFPLFWVREIRLGDAAISVLNAVFYALMLVASLRLGSLTVRFGNRRLVVAGAFFLALYPLLTALSRGIGLLLAASVLGGVVWAILGGALANRLLERIPTDDRPPYLALYNLALNGAMLIGSLGGTTIADAIGLREALFVATGLRLVAALLLWRCG
ncbi:MAG: MFS transporter [Anaerolineae bacterium]|nr:MFS transporter [Anaerolineae bacterium]